MIDLAIFHDFFFLVHSSKTRIIIIRDLEQRLIYGSTDKSRFSPRCRDGEIFSGDTAPARTLHPLNAVVNAVKARRVRGKERAEQFLGVGKYYSRFVILVVLQARFIAPEILRNHSLSYYTDESRSYRRGDRIIGPLRKDRRKVRY